LIGLIHAIGQHALDGLNVSSMVKDSTLVTWRRIHETAKARSRTDTHIVLLDDGLQMFLRLIMFFPYTKLIQKKLFGAELPSCSFMQHLYTSAYSKDPE
jgi:hypothetical protein